MPGIYTATAEIASNGEEDLFEFEVTHDGTHVIETSGSTDVVMSLFGPDDLTRFVAEDDDGGSGRNSRIVAALTPGTYFAQVKHFGGRGTGEYRIRVTAT